MWQHPESVAQFFSPTEWARNLSRPRGACLPDSLKDMERVKAAVLSMWESDRKLPGCFIHGDSHLGNIFFEADGTPGYVDFDSVMTNVWATDVVYFLIGALNVEHRRANERELIAHYLDRLRANGVDAPTLDEAWLAYRRHALHPFLVFMSPDGIFTEERITTLTMRASAAVTDLETFGSLAV
jgi:aminoglycoside phosphotransferase (APT) family kinase protein